MFVTICKLFSATLWNNFFSQLLTITKDLESLTQDQGPETCNLVARTTDLGSKTQDPGFGSQNRRPRTKNPGLGPKKCDQGLDFLLDTV